MPNPEQYTEYSTVPCLIVYCTYITKYVLARVYRGVYNGVERADSQLPGTTAQVVFTLITGAAIRGICAS
jgi:hypothetical protein